MVCGGCRTGPVCNRTGHCSASQRSMGPAPGTEPQLAARDGQLHDVQHHGIGPDTAGPGLAMNMVAGAKKGTLYNYQVSGTDSCAQVLSLGPSGGGLTLAGKS